MFFSGQRCRSHALRTWTSVKEFIQFAWRRSEMVVEMLLRAWWNVGERPQSLWFILRFHGRPSDGCDVWDDIRCDSSVGNFSCNAAPSCLVLSYRSVPKRRQWAVAASKLSLNSQAISLWSSLPGERQWDNTRAPGVVAQTSCTLEETPFSRSDFPVSLFGSCKENQHFLVLYNRSGRPGSVEYETLSGSDRLQLTPLKFLLVEKL